MFATSHEMREAVAAVWGAAEKTYLAVVQGCPKSQSGTIEQPLRLDAHDYFMHVGPHPEAKAALTRYEVKQAIGKRALLEVHLETGGSTRSRGSSAWLGHPVVGDARYGHVGPHMGLHAQRLVVTHPRTSKRLTLEAPV
ncbi:MAG: pseudouridine synthase [Myxococcota bacterium]